MTLDVNLSTILSGVILAGILGIFRKISHINGSVRELKTWQGEHVKQDDERHAAAEETRRSLWSAIDELRKRPLHELCAIGRKALQERGN